MPEGILRKITRRWWITLGACLGAYIGLGFWLRTNGAFETQLYKWGLLGASIAPLVLVVIYSFSGYKWWKNDIGSAIVQVKFCIVTLCAPLCWVFFVLHGMLLPGWVAWFEVSAPALVTMAMLRLCWVFMRIRRETGRHEEEAS